jgi:hypothetical protein
MPMGLLGAIAFWITALFQCFYARGLKLEFERLRTFIGHAMKFLIPPLIHHLHNSSGGLSNGFNKR